MKIFARLFSLVAVAALLSLPMAAIADDDEHYENDAKHAEDAPPVIPHPVADNATGDDCLVCHRTGINGAPLSPHAIRVNCTQCHVRSDLSDPKKAKKSKKHKKDKKDK